MKKLYSYFKPLSFTLLIIAGATQTMEMDVVPSAVVRPVPSLKQQCLDYIGQNAHHKKIVLIDNIAYLPAELAVKTLESATDTYIKKNRNRLLTLAKSNTLDTNVSCNIANRFFDMKLAYKLAEKDAITLETAAFIVYNFMETMNIKTDLDDFDAAFHNAFPEKILGNGNYGRLYYHLLKEIVTNDIYDFYCTIKDEPLFSVQDFEQNFSLKEIINFLTHKKFKHEALPLAYKNGLITLSPCKHFLAFSDDDHTVQIINLKTKNEIIIDVFFEDEILVTPAKLVFNQDCSQLGILDKDNEIHTVNIPIALLNNELSLQELTALAYCKEHLYKQIPIDNDNRDKAIEYILFQDNQEAYALGTFITKHRIIESFLQDFSSELLSTHEHTIDWSLLFRRVAAAFSMTKKEVAIKIVEDNQFIYKITEYLIDQNRELFIATLWDKEAMHFLQDTIVPILNNNKH